MSITCILAECGGFAVKVTSTEFQQNVGRYQDAAQHAPVAITKNGRTHTVLVSAAFSEMVMKGRIARPVEELNDGTLKAIANSEVPAEYAALDDLVKDWRP
jgi:PHD/YefM family antitoxin component YafN of YafNO toxin-antitoxin module